MNVRLIFVDTSEPLNINLLPTHEDCYSVFITFSRSIQQKRSRKRKVVKSEPYEKFFFLHLTAKFYSSFMCGMIGRSVYLMPRFLPEGLNSLLWGFNHCLAPFLNLYLGEISLVFIERMSLCMEYKKVIW